jgi:hypothetical protein
MKRPAFQFYPADWRKDMGLQSCSVAARGLWMDMMCIAHECEPYGHLTVNGKAMTPAQIGRHCGLTEKEAAKLVAELEDAGVFSRTADGVIYSRRMVADEDLRNRRAKGGEAGSEHGHKGAEHGKKGGRPPKARGVSEPPLEPPPSSSSSSSSSPSGLRGTEDHPHLAGGRAHEPDLAEVVGDSKPTQAGAICAALRRAGIGDTNPGHPRLLTLIAAGATEAEFTGFASAALGKSAGFAWVLGAVENERKRAFSASKALHQGVMPTQPKTPAWMAASQAYGDALVGKTRRAESPPAFAMEAIDAPSRLLD